MYIFCSEHDMYLENSILQDQVKLECVFEAGIFVKNELDIGSRIERSSVLIMASHNIKK